MEKKKLTAIIIQARSNSSRFYEKILKMINNKSLLEILLLRLKKLSKVDKIIVATTNSNNDRKIIKICKKCDVDYFEGSEANVQLRYYKAAKKFNISNIIRITSDCPLIDVDIVKKIIKLFFKRNRQYVSNILFPTYPDGMDVEMFSFESIKKRVKKKVNNFEKEHVTSFFIKKKIKKNNLFFKKDYSNLRLTVDTIYDYQIIKKLIEFFNNNIYISLKEIIELYEKKPGFFEKNQNAKRNLNMKQNLGQKYWTKAKKIIPGGTSLFTKNPDLHLPQKWPAYYSKAKNMTIWDLENNKYSDCFLMGVGTNSLGYANKFIDNKVKKEIDKSNMSSLNSIHEIIIAEKLIELHKWPEMARFTRSGGEANSLAIRIARAYTGKDNIAVCGYHGWHDWYLSSNLNNENSLDVHLLKNLRVEGVPKSLKGTTHTFEYNNFEKLKKIVNEKNIGIIKMEVERNEKPKNNFLKKVRKLATSKNIVLIFDECTSGFRETYGGLHLKYKVNPDIVILGKALGNGYAINAVLGKKEIMQSCQKTFISSTFWTEKIGYVAASETLNQMKKLKSWNKISSYGKSIKNFWGEISKSQSVKIKIKGIDALPIFYFDSKYHNHYKTLVSQEMLKENIIASNVIYASIFHKEENMKRYYNTLNKTFKKINDCENQKESIFNLLENEVCITNLRNEKN
tara:strand:+ start:4021 stop:6063 length:2043 start_codon:yes stop_codon:yes gene_type:complete